MSDLSSVSANAAHPGNNIHDQIGRRPAPSAITLAEYGLEPAIPPQLAENLSVISRELDALSAEIHAGEPQLSSASLRGRVGLWLKRQLYRFLWWHSYQIRTAVDLISRWTREEKKLIDALSRSPQSRKIRDIERGLLECERRLVEIESAQLGARLSEIERGGRQTVQEIEKLVQRLAADVGHKEHLADVEKSAKEAATGLAQRIEAESAYTRQLAIRLSDLGLFTHQTRANLSVQDSRLALFIEETRKHLPQPIGIEALRGMVNDHTQHRFDSLYAAFEDVFRGTREDVKSRQAVYLPLLQEHGIGSPAMPILDLGCGRGEWLELLGEHGLQACGVDLNEAMIDRCKSFGLHAVQADALPHLGTLPDGCLGAVTAFHMVEHMPFEVVLTLVDESLRVLKPGGILILETPNPSNLQVSALTFHLDPTHLKPLPSIMLRFFVEGRGFCDVDVRELHPYPEVLRFADEGKGLAGRLNEYFYGPQDYAVIGRKP